MMNEETRKKIGRRLSRVGGQVNGLQKMVEEDRYCVEILDQIAAARAALDAVGVEILSDHIEGCVIGSCNSSQHVTAKERTREELSEEVRLTLRRFLK